MKRPTTDFIRWNKYKKQLIQSNAIENLQDILKKNEKMYKNDLIGLFLTNSKILRQLCEDMFIIFDGKIEYKYLKKIYQLFNEAHILYNKGITTKICFKNILENEEENEIIAIYAIIAGDINIAKKFLNSNHIIYKLLCDEYEEISDMCQNNSIEKNLENIINCICKKDEEGLQKMVYSRIKDIRNQSNVIITGWDIWLTAILKIARQKRNMKFDCNFVEISQTLIEKNI